MNYLHDLWDDLISVLFPRLCQACGNHLMRNEKLICTECHVLIPRTDFHLTDDNPLARLFWGRCRMEKAAAFSFYNRDSRIRKLIHNLKYKGVQEIGIELGRIYGLILFSSGFTADMDIIVPVPLHPDKERSRGFNQSHLIARGISEVSGLALDAASLQRVVTSSTQTKKSRFERWRNVEDAFLISNPAPFRGKHVLLVDDVITTGATIESCVNELIGSGALKVSAAALAAALL